MVFLGIYLLIILSGLGVVAYLWGKGKDELAQDLPPLAAPQQAVIEEAEQLPPHQDWSITSIRDEFSQAQEQINELTTQRAKPDPMLGIGHFLWHVGYAIKLTWQEKEIITFAFLQWVAVAAGYLLWIQMLAWIPPEVWKSTEGSDGGSPADWVLFAWSFVCVGLATFPIGIFSACMGAVHFLRKQGRDSSIAACLQMVLPRAWPIWVFQWADGWTTVNQILRRLPKKGEKDNSIVHEALYYAWKLATVGILPGLVTGRGLVESCKGSIDLLRHKFVEVSALRVGYSALCWIIGIASYVGAIFLVMKYGYLIIPPGTDVSNRMYEFYLWMTLPILAAVAVVQLLLRPVYVIASCGIYSDYLNEQGQKIILPRPPAKSTSALVAFLLLTIAVTVVIVYRNELGITRLLSIPYHSNGGGP